MGKEHITARFASREDRDRFEQAYNNGAAGNYNGRSLETTSYDSYNEHEARLERSGVEDFTRLGQDIAVHGGHVVSDDE